jgi:hypothetical protein
MRFIIERIEPVYIIYFAPCHIIFNFTLAFVFYKTCISELGLNFNLIWESKISSDLVQVLISFPIILLQGINYLTAKLNLYFYVIYYLFYIHFISEKYMQKSILFLGHGYRLFVSIINWLINL